MKGKPKKKDRCCSFCDLSISGMYLLFMTKLGSGVGICNRCIEESSAALRDRLTKDIQKLKCKIVALENKVET